jgi:hypothetical protein
MVPSHSGVVALAARHALVPWGACALFATSPVAAQVGAVVNGRIEDAYSRTPIAGARVQAPDSTAVFTDSLGHFALSIDREPLYVFVEQYGYQAQRFDLPPEAPARTSVLLLEPIAFELEAISVVSESALADVFRALRGRRNSYRGSVQFFDRERLDRFAPVGSAWDLVVQRTSGNLHECDPWAIDFQRWNGVRSGLCVRGRATITDPFPQVPVLVCVDGWESWGAVTELESLDIRSVAMVEIYSRGAGGVRVYTGPYLSSLASRGQRTITPLGFGC